MDPKAFEQLVAMAQTQPTATPVAPVDPTALLRQPASGPAIRGPGSVAKKKTLVNPKVSERALAESSQADQAAEDLLAQLFAPQQQALEGFRKQRSEIAAKDTAPSWAMPLLAATDAWLGTNSAKSFRDANMTEEEKQAALLALDKQIGDDEAGIAKQKIDLVKADKNEELGYAKLAQMYDRMLASQAGGSGLDRETKMDDLIDKKNAKLQEKLSVYAKTRNLFSQLGAQQERIAGLRQLMTGNLDEKGRIQIAEFAHGLIPVVTGLNSGAGSDEQISRFIPKTLWSDLAGLKEYFSNKVEPAQAQNFLRTMIEVLNREAKIKESAIQRERQAVARSSTFLKKHAPDDYYGQLELAGIPEEEVNGLFDRKKIKEIGAQRRKEGAVPGALPTLTPITQEEFEKKLQKAAEQKKLPAEQIREAFKKYLGEKKGYDVEAIK